MRPPCTTLSVAFTLALVCSSSPAEALVTPLDFVVRGATDVHAILLEEGVFQVDEGRFTLACEALYGSARWLVWTGHDRHTLAVGDDGPWLTTEAGCHWQRTTGAADEQRVVGVYQPVEGGDRVVFAVDDPFGGTKVIETVDGGFTSTLAGDLAVTEVSFVGFAGRGDVAVIVGRTTDGGLRTWWTQDAGGTFEQGPEVARAVTETLAVAGYDGERVWCWDEGALFGLSANGDVDDDTPELEHGEGVVAGAGDGVTWLAAGADGLWRRSQDGAWEQRQTEVTTSVRVEQGRVWVARTAAHEGDPLVLRSGDGGETWWTAAAVPESWGFPDVCKSSVSQQCGATSDALRDALGLPVGDEAEEPVVEPEPPAPDGCSAPGSGEPVWLALLMVVAALSRRFRGTAWRSP